MSRGPRGDEELAAAVVRQVLGVQVVPLESRDTNMRPLDFEILYSDGSTAVLEVTWAAAPNALALDDQLARIHHQLPHHGEHNWFGEVSTPWELKRFRACYRHLIEVLDTSGAHSWEDLPPWVVNADEDVRWLAQSGSSLTRAPAADGLHPVYLLGASISAVWDETMDVITPAVEEILESDANVGAHLSKLLENGAAERHLFLIADLSGIAPAAAMELHDLDAPPSSAPPLPTGLTHLWLLPRFGRSVLLGTDAGWELHPLRDERAPSE